MADAVHRPANHLRGHGQAPADPQAADPSPPIYKPPSIYRTWHEFSGVYQSEEIKMVFYGILCMVF